MTELSELYQAREAIFLLPMTEYPQVWDMWGGQYGIHNYLKLVLREEDIRGSRGKARLSRHRPFPPFISCPSTQMEAIQKTFEPFASLWRFCAEFMRSLPEWMDGPFPGMEEIGVDVI